MNKNGFTLIELLIVVLIIGILAAIALPQYQKAVWKSRANQLQVSVSSLATAQSSYRLATSQWPSDFELLDLTFDNLPDKVKRVTHWAENAGSTAVRSNDLMTLMLWNMNNQENHLALGLFNTGSKYQSSGFTYIHKLDNVPANRLYCVETYDAARKVGDFCQQVVGLTSEPISYHLARFFPVI